MKEKKTSFVVLPFYMGCLSQITTCEKNSSQSRTKAMAESNQVATSMGVEGASSSSKLKRSWSYVAPRRSNITTVMDKLVKLTFRSFARVFAYKDIEDIKTETEMEIGFPTDVKHVTHIGYDGSMTTNLDKNWDHFQLQPLETHAFPSVSLKHLIEPTMANQTEVPTTL
ncbi:unnamed protein product [Lactuca saligna]|uniref:CRIB domain-containing protein n=1 Tax=Lactuca saligna TaxID=75948 RepID=A0AA35VV46_LACSI|nr:unnamed protein product [Lactuca saligna]